ncbi:MAG: hypothetical protein LH606_13210, partial [Cytophagaceae bacterium]|nr:hypothetical protein [Cytophagaceae bacterium]
AVALGIWVFSLVFQMALIRPGDYWLQFPLMNFNVFIFGFTTGVLFLKTARRGAAQRGAARQELADARRWQWALGALALSCIGLVVLVPGLQAYLGAFMNPVFASIIWWCARSRSWVVTRLLPRPPLVVLGEASYGVYILQVPVFLYLAGAFDFLSLPADPTLRFYISALVLVLVSTACFYWIETPCRNFINHRIGHRARRLTVAKTHTAKSRRQVVR